MDPFVMNINIDPSQCYTNMDPSQCYIDMDPFPVKYYYGPILSQILIWTPSQSIHHQ
jgi:hypothetical protein